MRAPNFFNLIFISSLLLSPKGWSNQLYTYQGVLSGVKTITKWIVKDSENKVDISGQNRGNEVKLEYTPTFNLQQFIEKEPDAAPFEVKREGEKLFVKNHDTEKPLNVGSQPWIQEFKFGFIPFLKSTDKTIDFAIVYRKDTSLHEMIASKEEVEKIQVNGKEYEAQKLKITLRGFKKRFWKAEVWYDTKKHLLIKYKSNEGPGTPYTEVTLLEEETPT
jgi:hypothetical protein